jgi:hypothetical protein
MLLQLNQAVLIYALLSAFPMATSTCQALHQAVLSRSVCLTPLTASVCSK